LKLLAYVETFDMKKETSEWPVLIRPRLAGFEVIGDTNRENNARIGKISEAVAC